MKLNRLGKYLLWILVAIAGTFFLGTLLIVLDGLQDKVGKADVALVLGNTVNPDGSPSPRLQARLDKTVELYLSGYFPLVIASGGVGKEGHDEAETMRDYLVLHGIPERCVIVDSSGTNTFESAKNTARIMRERKLASVLVVSQYFHLARARLALRNFGVTTIYSAHANFFEARDFYSSPREFIGYIEYSLRSYPRPSVPPNS